MAPDATSYTAAPDRIEWFRALRFGLFVHWGPVSIEGTEIGWSRAGDRRGLPFEHTPGSVPVERYDELYREFDPTGFDATEWVSIARAAGMRYLVFTTKHHDGFCNFDTAQTDYKITGPNCPFGRDIVRELTDACHAADLPIGFYHSQPDWRHQDYQTERHDRYISYLHAMVEELCTGYGDVAMIWFDGLRHPAEDWGGDALVRRIREWQPDILINDRCGIPCDFDTPEQRVGTYQTYRAWESCITMGDQWAWKPNDNLKSVSTCIQTLVSCVGGDGNLLFNVGPEPTGRIEARQVDRLRAMGEWLAVKGEAVYGTRGGPWPPGGGTVEPQFASTHNEQSVYLFFTNPRLNRIVLADPPMALATARRLGHGGVEVIRRGNGMEVSIDRPEPDEIVPVVAFDRA